MKTMIINKTKLSMEDLGKIIHMIQEESYDDTNYYGKIDYCKVGYKGNEYKIQIRTLKTYTEWIFVEA